jgi:ADP-ribose pyrophosphatase YjhB (NUDIX family)
MLRKTDARISQLSWPCPTFHERPAHSLRSSFRISFTGPPVFASGFFQAKGYVSVTQREFPAHPLVGVGAVIFDSAGRVLLVRRGRPPGLGRWSLPGGLLELGETLKAGAEREVYEETGLIVSAETIVEVVDRIYMYSGHDEEPSKEPRVQYHYVVIDYWCRLNQGGDLKPASDATDVAWVTQDEWRDTGLYSLDSIAVQVIEKAWLIALEADPWAHKILSPDGESNTQDGVAAAPSADS